jgi:DNA-binding transcriptional regulator YiaG
VDNDINYDWKRGAMQNRRTVDRREIARYGIKEAAKSLGMPVATLDSWVNGRKYPTSTGLRFFKPLIDLASPGTLSFTT